MDGRIGNFDVDDTDRLSSDKRKFFMEADNREHFWELCFVWALFLLSHMEERRNRPWRYLGHRIDRIVGWMGMDDRNYLDRTFSCRTGLYHDAWKRKVKKGNIAICSIFIGRILLYKDDRNVLGRVENGN